MLDVTVIDDPAAAEASLDPIRVRLLAELAQPGSASTLATRVGLTRQKANYHLRELERHGLVELVETVIVVAREEHATLTLLRYEDGGRLVHAGAHEDILIHRAKSGCCEVVETNGIWAGLIRDPPAGVTTDAECALAPGDTVLLHTDGVTEARNAAREMFGKARLSRALERAAGLPVEEVRDRILDEVRAFMSHQADDLTLVVLRYR